MRGVALALALALAAAAHAAQSRAASPLDEAQLAQLGYFARGSECPGPTAWEKQTFGAVGKCLVHVRARQPLPGPPPFYFVRLTIVEERYPSAALATARAAQPMARPPLPAEAAKSFPLRRGFALGKSYWLVTTDAFMFEPAMARAVEQLQALLTGTKGSPPATR